MFRAAILWRTALVASPPLGQVCFGASLCPAAQALTLDSPEQRTTAFCDSKSTDRRKSSFCGVKRTSWRSGAFARHRPACAFVLEALPLSDCAALSGHRRLNSGYVLRSETVSLDWKLDYHFEVYESKDVYPANSVVSLPALSFSNDQFYNFVVAVQFM